MTWEWLVVADLFLPLVSREQNVRSDNGEFLNKAKWSLEELTSEQVRVNGGLKDVLVMYDVLKGGVMSVGWCGWVDEPWPEGRVATNKTNLTRTAVCKSMIFCV